MRITNSSSNLTCYFIEDIDSGCLVDTPDGEMNTKDMGEYNEPFYLKDGTEIFYPGWASW
jgi:hypothetical protein